MALRSLCRHAELKEEEARRVQRAAPVGCHRAACSRAWAARHFQAAAAAEPAAPPTAVEAARPGLSGLVRMAARAMQLSTARAAAAEMAAAPPVRPDLPRRWVARGAITRARRVVALAVLRRR